MTKSSTLRLTLEFVHRFGPVILFMACVGIVAAIPPLIGSPNLSSSALRKAFAIKMGLVSLGSALLGLLISLFFFIFLPDGLKKSRQMLKWEEEELRTLTKPYIRNLTNEKNKQLKSDS